MKKSKTVLVTGGAGFIGSNLIELLVKDPQNQVYSLDDYSTGSLRNHMSGVSYLTGHTVDICGQRRLIDAKPEWVFHLGEYSRVEKSFEDIPIVRHSNINGTHAVIEFCLTTGAKLVYAGSSTRFCDGGEGRRQSPYAITKAFNADWIPVCGKQYGLNYAITYFYNVYGPREISDGGFATVIGIFKDRMRRGQPLPVVRPGTQVRNFTHVDDIVRGLVLVAEQGKYDYSLGANEGYSILEVAQMFGGEIDWLDERPGNRMAPAKICTRARDELGWRPQNRLEDHINCFRQDLQMFQETQRELVLGIA